MLSFIRILTPISKVTVIQVNEATKSSVFQRLKEISLEDIYLMFCEHLRDTSPREDPLLQYHTLLSYFERKEKMNIKKYPPLFQFYGELVQFFNQKVVSFLYLNSQVLKFSTKPYEGYASIIA